MILLIFLCVLLALVLGVSYYAYRIAFYAAPKGTDLIPTFQEPWYDAYRPELLRLLERLQRRPWEAVTIRSQEGLRLAGRYYHVQDGAPLDICFHGYRSSPMTDFIGGGELSLEMEHNLLLVDQRSHGRSQGRSICFGIQERWDVSCWVAYALERFGKELPIFLYGVSMGASTVLMASDLGLPANVKGIVADCPYARPKDIIQRVAKKMGYPPKLFWPLIKLGAKLYGGFLMDETDAVRAVARTDIPILLLHGEADDFVPCDMSRQVAQANPGLVQRHTFPGAGHGMSFLVDPQRYRQLLTGFVRQQLQ